jgi:hypothetical protein
MVLWWTNAAQAGSHTVVPDSRQHGSDISVQCRYMVVAAFAVQFDASFAGGVSAV